jgi:hypothetical protein
MRFELYLEDKKPIYLLLHSSLAHFWLGVEFLSSTEIEGKLNPVFATGILDNKTAPKKIRCSVLISTELIEYKPVNEEHEQIKRR